MNQLLLHNARVIIENRVERGGVLVRDGRIAQVFAQEDKPAGLSANELIDLRNAYLAPGMIDIHIHGSAGVDVQDADSNEIARLSRFLLAEGVTGYFATFVPTDECGYRKAVAEIESYIANQDKANAKSGARILGIHFEGPFVSHNKCGALKRKYFRTYDGDARSIELFTVEDDKMNQRSARLMTLAPETDGSIELARELTRKNVRAFIGHTQADPDTLDRAVEAGARHITHFPNALEQLHHRRPGAVAWGLVRDDITIDCIADFHHIAPLMLHLIYKSKGANRMALISDAIKPAGLGDGEFIVWDEKIAVRDRITSLVEGPSRGTIAGSVITMRDALRNIFSLGVPLHEAISMATSVPARAAGVFREHGSIEAGKRADLFAFDEDFNVRLTVVNGLIALDKS